MKFQAKVLEGESAPFGHGYAYRDFITRTTISYLVPFNFIVRWIRDLWFWLIMKRSGYQEKIERRFYHTGLREGNEIGYRRGYSDGVRDGVKIENERVLRNFNQLVEDRRNE